MSIYHHPRIVTDGLVLHLDAANKKSYPGSGTVWYDLSKNKYRAIPVNSSFPTFNSSTNDFTFNGSSQYLRIPFTGSITNHTLVVWCKLNTLTPSGSSAAGGILGIGVDGNQGPTGGFMSLVFNETIAGRWVGQTAYGVQAFFSNSNETSTEYVMIAISYAANSYIMYRNAIPIGSRTTSSPYTYTNGSMMIGTRHFTNSSYASVTNGYFNGKVAIAQMYDRALTQNEILQIYNATKNRFSTNLRLAFYQPMEGSLNNIGIEPVTITGAGSYSFTTAQYYSGSQSLNLTTNGYYDISNYNIGSDACIVDLWYKSSTTSQPYYSALVSDTGTGLYIGSSTYFQNTIAKPTRMTFGSVNIDSSTSMHQNTWVRITMGRTSDGYTSLYFNGVLQGTAYDATALTTPIRVGKWGGNTIYDNSVYGYVDNFKIYKGYNITQTVIGDVANGVYD